MKKYDDKMKKSMVKKYLSQPELSIKPFCKQENIPPSTFRGWIGLMKNKKVKTTKFSMEEKFQLLMEYSSLEEEKSSTFLRKHGIYSETINQWKQECLEACKAKALAKKSIGSKNEDKEKIKKLEKEIKRKDKALAEVSALLILKKKADLIFGTIEEEE